MHVMGYTLTTQLPCLAEQKGQLVMNTLNSHSYVVAGKDRAFRKALQNSDCLFPDGIGIVAACRVILHRRVPKIAGVDLLRHLLVWASHARARVLLFGSSRRVLNAVIGRIREAYPGVVVDAIAPPFRKAFTEAESATFVQDINRFRPTLLLVSMTAPKQEKWVQEHRDRLSVPLIANVGAAFEYFAGLLPRPSGAFRLRYFEWLTRLLRDPRKIWRRVFLSEPVFFAAVGREIVLRACRVRHTSR